jgi:preprotein translocase SecE subunit
MAIARTQKDNISDIEIAKKDSLGKVEKKDSDKPKETKSTKKKVERKPGFITSTISELRKVEWPGFRYVVNWSLTIIVFTTVFSLVIGFADHIFSAGIGFANCSSPANEDSRTVQECADEFVTNITFRD